MTTLNIEPQINPDDGFLVRRVQGQYRIYVYDETWKEFPLDKGHSNILQVAMKALLKDF